MGGPSGSSSSSSQAKAVDATFSIEGLHLCANKDLCVCHADTRANSEKKESGRETELESEMHMHVFRNTDPLPRP